RWFVDRLPQQGIPSVSLRRLLPEARFVGCPDWEVSGCTADSRRLDPGQVFVAVRGSRHDGHAFVPQALERGAAGVIVERPGPEGLAAMLAEMVERGCLGGVIEVSGEVLQRRRVEGLSFDAAVVTDLGAPPNLPADALRARRRSKARLFRKVVPGGLAVVNA